VVDSTPVECGRSKETTRRSDLAGCAEYGYCASHSPFFRGLRPHLLCTLGGLPIGFASTGAKTDQRQTLPGILNADPTLIAERPGQTLIGDKNNYGKDFENTLAAAGIDLLRPARQGRTRPPRSSPVHTPASEHRVDQPDLQRPTRPRNATTATAHRSHSPRACNASWP
jgi:Transposase DDE domain